MSVTHRSNSAQLVLLSVDQCVACQTWPGSGLRLGILICEFLFWLWGTSFDVVLWRRRGCAAYLAILCWRRRRRTRFLSFYLSQSFFFDRVEDRQRVLDRMVNYIFYLKLILVVGVGIRERTEFLREMEAVRDILRWYEIFGHLDAIMEVTHLVRSSSWDKNSITQTLYNRVSVKDENPLIINFQFNC